MIVPFVKMHGAGNDFVMIDDRAHALTLSSDAIAAVCSRRRGIGGDGLILVQASAAADFRMRYFNGDGGEADLCGNGARCAARFAYDEGIAREAMTFESRAGLVRAEILGLDVRVWLGPVTGLRLALSLEAVPGEVHYGFCGVPHAVIIESNVRARTTDDFIALARRIRNHSAFGPAGANVNIVSVIDRSHCIYRTYERGVEGETLACGTGAAVVAAILAHRGLGDAAMSLETSGADTLHVDLDLSPDGAFETRLTGPAVVSFRGTFSLEDFEHP